METYGASPTTPVHHTSINCLVDPFLGTIFHLHLPRILELLGAELTNGHHYRGYETVSASCVNIKGIGFTRDVTSSLYQRGLIFCLTAVHCCISFSSHCIPHGAFWLQMVYCSLYLIPSLRALVGFMPKSSAFETLDSGVGRPCILLWFVFSSGFGWRFRIQVPLVILSPLGLLMINPLIEFRH